VPFDCLARYFLKKFNSSTLDELVSGNADLAFKFAAVPLTGGALRRAQST
jgi:hypothetical protein